MRRLFHASGKIAEKIKWFHAQVSVSEVAAKDESYGIKSVTCDDILAALRVPRQLLGILPQNSGGFESIRDAASV